MASLQLAPASCKRPRSKGRRRREHWGLLLTVHSQPRVQQDELEALEALCFLSSGVTTPQGIAGWQQQEPPKASPRGTRAHHQQQQQQRRQQSGKQQKQPKQAKQQGQKRPQGRHSPGGSDTSSGATQCGLAAAHAAELQACAVQQPALPLPLGDIHPAALPNPTLLLQQHQQPQCEQQQSQQQAVPLGAPGSPAVAAAGPADVAAPAPAPPPAVPHQLHSLLAGADVGGLLQQLQVGLQVPAMQPLPAASSVHALMLPPPPQQKPLLARPPVKGCFWHVYIARMIDADRKKQEQQRRRPAQAADQDAAPGGPQQQPAQGPNKKRRTAAPQQQRQDPGAAGSMQPAPAPQQQQQQAQALLGSNNAAAALLQGMLAGSVQPLPPSLAPTAQLGQLAASLAPAAAAAAAASAAGRIHPPMAQVLLHALGVAGPAGTPGGLAAPGAAAAAAPAAPSAGVPAAGPQRPPATLPVGPAGAAVFGVCGGGIHAAVLPPGLVQLAGGALASAAQLAAPLRPHHLAFAAAPPQGPALHSLLAQHLHGAMPGPTQLAGLLPVRGLVGVMPGGLH